MPARLQNVPNARSVRKASAAVPCIDSTNVSISSTVSATAGMTVEFVSSETISRQIRSALDVAETVGLDAHIPVLCKKWRVPYGLELVVTVRGKVKVRRRWFQNMRKDAIISNVVTALITTVIIVATTFISNWASDGGLINALGGAVDAELEKVRDDLGEEISNLGEQLQGAAKIKYAETYVIFYKGEGQGDAPVSGVSRRSPINDEGHGFLRWEQAYKILWSWDKVTTSTFETDPTITTESQEDKVEVTAALGGDDAGYAVVRISYLVAVEE